ncbi:MAG: hypothetical protein ACXWDO_08720, partial [Bacteroidia bacterium]
LNHYIGMKYIKEEMFPELKYMPYIVGAIIALGLLAATVGRKYMLVIFALIIVAAGIAGAVDFYLWSYDYGHNLDPRAPIKVPGMSYQPPMFGSKDLLNFTATSWPAIGGISIMVAALVSVILSIYELRKK